MSIPKLFLAALLVTVQICDAQRSDVVVDVSASYDTSEGRPFSVKSLAGTLAVNGSASFQTTLRVAAGGPSFPEGPQGPPSNTSAWPVDASGFDFVGQNWVGFALPRVDHRFPLALSCTPDKNNICEGIVSLRHENDTAVDLPWAQDLDLSLPVDLYVRMNASSPVEFFFTFEGGPEDGVLVVPLDAPQKASVFGFGGNTWGYGTVTVSTSGIQVNAIVAVRPTLRWTFTNTNDTGAQPVSGAVAIEAPRIALESLPQLRPNTQCVGTTKSGINNIYGDRSVSVVDLSDGNEGIVIKSLEQISLPIMCDRPSGSFAARVQLELVMLLGFMFAAVCAS